MVITPVPNGWNISQRKMKKSRKIKSVVTLGVGLFVLRTALFVWTLNIAMNSYQYINGSWWEWNSSDGVSKEKQHGKDVLFPFLFNFLNDFV